MEYIQHLSKDKVLAKLLKEHGALNMNTETKDLFTDLLSSITSQQLSTKAASTIWGRFENLFPKKRITPSALLKLDNEKIREAGISRPKIKYMKGLAQMVLDKEIILDNLPSLTNEEIIKELTKIKGIGRWTAEMILMFSLSREDVFSLGDLGLRNAIAKHYNVDRDNLEIIEKITQKWSPYRTYAALYLWRSLDNKPTVS